VKTPEQLREWRRKRKPFKAEPRSYLPQAFAKAHAERKVAYANALPHTDRLRRLWESRYSKPTPPSDRFLREWEMP
jgi:hypothetical protein